MFTSNSLIQNKKQPVCIWLDLYHHNIQAINKIFSKDFIAAVCVSARLEYSESILLTTQQPTKVLYNTFHVHPFRHMYNLLVRTIINTRKLSYSNIHSDIDGIIRGSVSCPWTLQHAAGGIKLPPISGRPAPTLEPQPPSTFKTQVWKIVVKKVKRFICFDNKYSMYCSPFSSVIYLHSIQSHQQ